MLNSLLSLQEVILLSKTNIVYYVQEVYLKCYKSILIAYFFYE